MGVHADAVRWAARHVSTEMKHILGETQEWNIQLLGELHGKPLEHSHMSRCDLRLHMQTHMGCSVAPAAECGICACFSPAPTEDVCGQMQHVLVMRQVAVLQVQGSGTRQPSGASLLTPLAAKWCPAAMTPA